MALINAFPQGAGGGHTIQNNSGTDMTARSKLQFKGLGASDDSTNDRTIIDASNKINNSSVAPTEANMVATRAYLQDELLVVGGVLYKAKTAIAINDALVIGTNIEATTVEDRLDSIVSVPDGGTTGQVLTKHSNTDKDVEWSSSVADNIPDMTGATAYTNGYKGLAPTPTNEDVNKALFGDGKYHNIYTSASASTVVVSTVNTDLFGRTVTLTDGETTLSGTISNTGEYTFTNVTLYGNVTASCTDLLGNESKGSAFLSYFGTYMIVLYGEIATIEITNSDGSMLGKTVDIKKNGLTVQQAVIPASGTVSLYVAETGTYQVEYTGNDGLAKGTVSVSAFFQTYTVDVIRYRCYAWVIDCNDSNPATCVTPYNSVYGCENLNFTPAHMDFTNDAFDYGSWTGNEFFFPKPCMLNYDGTVAYYLNPNDYTKKADGTASDVGDFSYNGNVMVEFPTIYFKRWEDASHSYCVISDKQIDTDFYAYAHHDTDGNVLPYIYIAAYDGSYDGTRCRSISGKGHHNRETLTSGYIMSNTTRQQEVNFAKANNASGETGEGWYTWHKADKDMVNDLLILLGMNTNTQATFGRGRDSGYVSPTNTGIVTTGSMNTKGLFWGKNDSSAGVKIFGIENWWGNIWKAVAGWINNRGTQQIKMTYGTEDGSTATGFNFDGTGYTTVASAAPSSTSGGYISKWHETSQGMVPYIASGSDSTYLADGLWFTNSQNDYVVAGGCLYYGLRCGAFCSSLADATSYAGWSHCAALSYKTHT